MPMSLVRYVALLVFLLGGTMLALRWAGNSSGTGYDTIRLVHILVALGLLGLYETSLARSKRAGTLSEQGRQYGLAARIALTLAFLIGLFLLLSLFLKWITGGAFDVTVYIHAIVGIIAVSLASVVFWRQKTGSRTS